MASTTTDYGEIHAAIGRRIRKQRRLAGLTQSNVASALDVTFQQIQKYESGQSSISCGRLIRIAEILCVTPAELIGPSQKFPAFDNQAPPDAASRKLWEDFSLIKSANARRMILQYILQSDDDGGQNETPPGSSAPNPNFAGGIQR
jgi:transcriptional regulator with XRE-family HTH domain